MLFNTLAYAKFFAIVFAASWLLRSPSGGLWLPWLALAGVGLFSNRVFDPQLLYSATPEAGGAGAYALIVCGACFGLTWFNTRAVNPSATPSLARSCISSTVNLGPLAWIVFREHRQDLLSFFAAQCLNLEAVRGTVCGPWLALGAASLSIAAASAVLRVPRLRIWLLLVASYVFYARWDYRFLFLIFASSSADYWLGLKIGDCIEPRTRKRWLWLTVILNLGVLCFFKYLNFGVDSVVSALRALGYQGGVGAIEIALPVGISFFTFESMSYVIDVYRKDLPAHRSYLEYLTFVAFFPHLVAGPIVRPRDLLPQLAQPGRFSETSASGALYLITWGLIKKVAIGDYLALNLIDRVFDAPAQYSSLECYVAVVAYAIQIYCDFSGYTDIAIGSAALLGVYFPQNFNSPYKAASIQDFWRRWHISLSTWLRDYLYVPLGGNRHGNVRTYVNLMLTMLLGGLWHGASFTFVVWGGMHGVALAANRLLAGRIRGHWTRVVGPLLTFHFVCATWVFFRAPNFHAARAFFSQLAQLTTYTVHLPATVLGALAAGLVSHLLPETWYRGSVARFAALPGWTQGLLLLGAAFLLREVASADSVPFVYFQF